MNLSKHFTLEEMTKSQTGDRLGLDNLPTPAHRENLRALCEGRAPQPWVPQRRALYLISTGDRHALASWGPFSWGGDWVWRWKDRIDRGFMRRFGGQA